MLCEVWIWQNICVILKCSKSVSSNPLQMENVWKAFKCICVVHCQTYVQHLVRMEPMLLVNCWQYKHRCGSTQHGCQTVICFAVLFFLYFLQLYHFHSWFSMWNLLLLDLHLLYILKQLFHQLHLVWYHILVYL